MPTSKDNRITSINVDTFPRDFSQPHFIQVHSRYAIGRLKAAVTSVDAFRHCMQPLWIALRAIGAFPIQHNQGIAVFERSSRAMVYFLTMNLLMTLYTGLVIRIRITAIDGRSRFKDLIFSYMCIIYGCAFWISPIGHLMGARSTVQYINDWYKFQTRMYKLTGIPCRLTFGDNVRFATFFIPVFSGLLVSAEFVLLKAFTLWETLYYVYINIVMGYHVVLWYFVCQSIIQSSSHLIYTLAKEVAEPSCSPGVITEFRGLWEDLSDLTRETGDALVYVYGGYFMLWFTLLTGSLYGGLSEFMHNDGTFKGIGLGSNAVLIFSVLLMHCNVATEVASSVGSNFLHDLKRFQSQNSQVQEKLEVFQKTVSVDLAEVSLGGYVTVNRKLIITYMSTIATYLVVLLQFSDSPGIEKITFNETVTEVSIST